MMLTVHDDVRNALTIETNFPGLDLAPDPVARALVLAHLLLHGHDSLRELRNLLALFFELRISVAGLNFAKLLVLILFFDLCVLSPPLTPRLQDMYASALGGCKTNNSHAQCS